MASYLLLYSGGSMPQTEAEQKAVLEAWTAWYNRAGWSRGGSRQSHDAQREDHPQRWQSQ